MAVSLRNILPAPQHQTFAPEVTEDTPLYPTQKRVEVNKGVPPYGQRTGWVPRVLQDYGEGGAFPEIHVAQYPLNMAKKGASQEGQIVALTSDSSGRLAYDAVVKQGHGKDVVVFSKYSDMVEKNFLDEDLARPDEADEKITAQRTMEMLQNKMDKKTVKDPVSQVGQNVKYIRYTPADQGAAFNSGASHRIIRMTEMAKDPLEPPKFKFTKAVAAPGSPPVPVMHSPPKKLSKEDRDAWKIPPSISNWKNPKGYMIPLDKRLATDGRDLQENKINDAFANLSESLYIAERTAREEVSKRLNLKRELELQQQRERDEELMRVATEARMQRENVAKATIPTETREERMQRIEREKIREERRLEREREHRLSQRGREAKKSKTSRDFERDIGEKIALGEVVPRTQESLFDSRLFNKTGGLDSGLADDEGYNVYDKRLFGGERERALYKAPQREETELYGGAQSIDEIANTKRFKPHKDFEGVDRAHNTERTGPVQYERDTQDEYGLSQYVNTKPKEKERKEPSPPPQQTRERERPREGERPREERDRRERERGGDRERDTQRERDRDRNRERERRDRERRDSRSPPKRERSPPPRERSPRPDKRRRY